MSIVDKFNTEKKLDKDELKFLREKEKIISYLAADKLRLYLANVILRQYSGNPNRSYNCTVSYALGVIDFLYRTQGNEKIKKQYNDSLMEFIQSDKKSEYYTALEFIYVHLIKEDIMELKIDNIELFIKLKESIEKNNDYLKSVSYGMGSYYDENLYGFVKEIESLVGKKTL